MLIFSKPKTAKVRDMQRSPAVSLALDSADGGQDIVLADGRAKLITAAGEHPHFLAGQFREKYARSLGAMSFEQWRSTFSQPVLIHVEPHHRLDENGYRTRVPDYALMRLSD